LRFSVSWGYMHRWPAGRLKGKRFDLIPTAGTPFTYLTRIWLDPWMISPLADIPRNKMR